MAVTSKDAHVAPQASFRERYGGTLVDAGSFHDLTRYPGGFQVALEAWERAARLATGSVWGDRQFHGV